MKQMSITLGVLLLIFLVFQSYMSSSLSKIEKQPYRVIRKAEGFEVRYYPPAMFATVRSKAKSYRELSGNGFRRIAGYIFGDNASSEKIAMTSPVHMDINDSNSSMSFVMPATFNEESLPRPNDPSILIHQTKGEYVAALSFGGFANDASIRKYSEQLREHLLQQGIKVIGNYRYLGYNPPYQLIGRKNEIIVEVDWKAVD